MSTELVAIERITIRKGDSNADDIRSCLAHYLLQFINSASIESLSMHKLSIKVDGKTVLFVQDKTGGVGLKGLDTDWQHTPEMSAILDQLVTDVDVEVLLSYEMIHFFSTENFYGYNFWSEVLQEYGCEAVRYKDLEYYDVESNVVMLSFDGKELCDNPDYVPESAVKDKPMNREEVYAEKINATVKTKAVFSDQADQVLYQVKRFGQKMAVAYSMTQDSKTSGEQAKCLTLLASAERIFYDRLDDAIRSASMFDETEYKAFQQGIISFGDTDTAKKKQEIYAGIIKTINNVVHDNERLILRLDSLAFALNQRSAQNPWDTDVVLAMSRLDDVITKTNQDLEQDEEISREALKRYDTLNGGN